MLVRVDDASYGNVTEVITDDDNDDDLDEMRSVKMTSKTTQKRKKPALHNDSSTDLSNNDDDGKRNRKKRKHAKKEVPGLKALLKEMKEIKKNVVKVNTRVEETQAKVKIEDDWPEKHFKNPRDQHEYDALKVIEKNLDLALNSFSVEEALEYIETAKERAKDRITTLKVAKNYGWEVAAELPQSKDKGLADVMDNIDKAQQTAATRRNKWQNQTDRRQFFRGSSYDERQPEKPRYNARPISREPNPRNTERQITCYTWGGLGHFANDCPSSKTDRPDQTTHTSDNPDLQLTADYARAQRKKAVDSLNRPSSVSYWQEKIKASPMILSWLRYGISLFPRGLLPLARMPTPKQFEMDGDQET
jgi:hypothetical protein